MKYLSDQNSEETGWSFDMTNKKPEYWTASTAKGSNSCLLTWNAILRPNQMKVEQRKPTEENAFKVEQRKPTEENASKELQAFPYIRV